MNTTHGVLVLSLFLLSGCGMNRTHVVQFHEPIQSAHAPINEQDLAGGTVEYYKNGTEARRKIRRENAYKTMKEKCKGDYEIVGEGPYTQSEVAVPLGGMMVSDATEYWRINFKCVKTSPTAP